MPLDAHTKLVALLGQPVAHSLSPFIHNTAFRHQGLNWAYVALPVRLEDVAAAVAGLRALQFEGANVTIPHKQAVVPLLDALSPQARAVGAVNTIARRAEPGAPGLYGDNTDVAGFLEPLRALRPSMQGVEALVFGTGGAARAVVYALLSVLRPGRLTLVARDPAKGERLAGDLAAHDATDALRVTPWDEAADAVRTSALLVNATPLGMEPATGETPWPHVEDLTPDHIVYDLVYAPVRTRWLRDAAARGARTISGLEMLVGQAAAAYRRWTGRAMPVDVVRDALHTRLKRAG